MADWQAIKTEYITTNTSYRKLAEKYGVSATQIYTVGGKEGWVEKRKQYQSKTEAKTISAISDKQADRVANLISVSDILLAKVKSLLESDSEALNETQNIKHLSGVLKDIKDIQMVKSDADMREQEARIAKLQREAEAISSKNDDDNKACLIVEGLPEEFKA